MNDEEFDRLTINENHIMNTTTDTLNEIDRRLTRGGIGKLTPKARDFLARLIDMSESEYGEVIANMPSGTYWPGIYQNAKDVNDALTDRIWAFSVGAGMRAAIHVSPSTVCVYTPGKSFRSPVIRINRKP